MTVGIVYQLTFFVALGLLATVVTIFVFAVSLLGRAIEVAAKEQEKTTKDQKDAIEIEIDKILKQISSLQKKKSIGKELQELEKRLKKLRKQDEEFARKLGRIVKAPELLTVKGGVVPTASYILGALILSGVAYYLFTIENLLWLIHVLIWILGLAAIGYSIFRIYQSLKVIESIAITSEEAALKRTVEAFKIAEKELEEERRPVLKLEFEDKQPPFRMETQSERLIKFAVSLSRGATARAVTAAFFTPANFEYPDNPAKLPAPQSEYKDCNSARIDLGDIISPFGYPKSLKLKAPAEPGHYIAAYKLYCEGYFSNFVEFEIEVEEQEIPS